MKTMTLTASPTYHKVLRRLLSRALIVSGLIATIYPAQANEITDISKLMQSGQYTEALAKTDAVLAKHPRDAQMRFIKGLILAEQKKPTEAIALFAKLTEDFPDLPEPYNNLAVLYAAQGQYDKARAALDMAIRTNPTYATALENLGDIYAKLASQAYDKALQLDPGSNVLQPKLMLVRSLTGNITGGTNPKLANSDVNGKAVTTMPSVPAVIPDAAPITTAPALPAPPPEPKAKLNLRLEPKSEVKLAAPQPVEPAVEKEADVTRADMDKTAILTAVNNWAKAWSDMDVKSYLASYDADFQTPKGQSRKQWADERRLRIEEKGHINVKIQSPQITFKNNTATVRFRQIYSSNRLTVDSRKTLILNKQNNRWLIKQERSGG